MHTSTATTRTLEIDGMSGDACVQKVTGALKSVQGVTTQSVKVGAATIQADQAACDAACATLGRAGHQSREGGAGDTGGAQRATANTPTDRTGDNHPKATGPGTGGDHSNAERSSTPVPAAAPKPAAISN